MEGLCPDLHALSPEASVDLRRTFAKTVAILAQDLLVTCLTNPVSDSFCRVGYKILLLVMSVSLCAHFCSSSAFQLRNLVALLLVSCTTAGNARSGGKRGWKDMLWVPWAYSKGSIGTPESCSYAKNLVYLQSYSVETIYNRHK